MSKFTESARLEFILEMIEDIEFFLQDDNSIVLALQNRKSKPAILMSLMQIGETLHKIESNELQKLLPIKGAYDVRNFIAHDYEGVDLGLIENILRSLIPKLKNDIIKIINKANNE